MSLTNIHQYRTTFTPIDNIETSKQCQGKCMKILSPTKFDMKESIRGGIKGRVRNISCIECRSAFYKDKQSDTNDRLLHLEKTNIDMTTKISNMEALILKLESRIDEILIREI